MQISKDRSWRISNVISPSHQAASQNDEPVDQEQHSHKEPDWNNMMFFAHGASPENDLQDGQNCERCDPPKQRAMKDARVLLVRDLGEAIHKALQFLVGLGLGNQSNEDGHYYTGHARPKGLIHVLGEALRLRRKREHSNPSRS